MKLIIYGSPASGKTTLAKKLSQQYGVAFFQVDILTKIECPEEREAQYDKIFRREHWILDGSQRGELTGGMERCDVLIYLDIPLPVRMWRVFTRWIKWRKNDKKLLTVAAWKELYWFFRWAIRYTVRRSAIFAALEPYKDKLRSFKTTEAAEAFVAEQYGRTPAVCE